MTKDDIKTAYEIIRSAAEYADTGVAPDDFIGEAEFFLEAIRGWPEALDDVERLHTCIDWQHEQLEDAGKYIRELHAENSALKKVVDEVKLSATLGWSPKSVRAALEELFQLQTKPIEDTTDLHNSWAKVDK